MVHDATEALKRSERDLAEVIAQGDEVRAVSAQLVAAVDDFLNGGATDEDQD